MTAMFLTPAELADLTGRTQPSAQLRALARMGIVGKRNAAGEVKVLRGHAEDILRGQAVTRQRRDQAPDFGAMRA